MTFDGRGQHYQSEDQPCIGGRQNSKGGFACGSEDAAVYGGEAAHIRCRASWAGEHAGAPLQAVVSANADFALHLAWQLLHLTCPARLAHAEAARCGNGASGAWQLLRAAGWRNSMASAGPLRSRSAAWWGSES